MTNYNECLLCNNAACTRACGVKDPAKILRSLHFENYNVVRNNLDESNSCLDCDQRCVDACPEKIDIPSVFSSLYEHPLEEKTKIDRDILKCDFCGIPLENPFLLSSSVVASTYDMCARAFDAGWAGAAFKTICLMDIVEASPRFFSF